MDEAFLKSVYGGMLLSLASENSEDRSVVLAIAITTEPESEAKWIWFLRQCKSHLNEMDREGVGIVPDQDKSLKLFLFL